MTPYQQFIAKSRYARYLPEHNRREHWNETVKRYFDFMEEQLLEKQNYNLAPELRLELETAVLNLEIMPSMRLMMTAGEAAKRQNVAGFNCSYLPMDDPKSFDEAMYILLCGTGVGFSVENKYVSELPEIPDRLFESDTTISVSDSKEGWAKALRQLIALLYSGEIPKWDVSKVRKAGEVLKTFGGRASGPAPLVDLFNFCIFKFKQAVGRKLSSLEVHDIVCKIGEVVVVGGVRRCLPALSRVQTSSGYRFIKDLNSGDLVTTNGKNYKILNAGFSGIKPLLGLKHRFGELKCTKEHKVAVFDSMGSFVFKEAKDIIIGDRLVWDALGIEGSQVTLPKGNYAKHFNSNLEAKIPETLTPDLAWLIGLVLGDGSIQPKTVEISTVDTEYKSLEKANEIFLTYFGVSGKIDKDSHKGNCIRLRVNSTEISKWFFEFVKKPNINIIIPEFIFKSSKECRFAFLAGLFDSDGRCRPDGVIEQCSTIYETFMLDLVTLLSNLGIASVVSLSSREAKRLKGGKNKDAWSIRIVGNTNRKNWLYCAKYSMTNKLNVHEFNFKGPIDFSWPKQFHKMKSWTSNMNHSSAQELFYYDSNYLPVTVTAIKEYTPEDTYDIEVEIINQFTVDGLVVHNSAMISLSDLSDEKMRKAKAGDWWNTNGQRALSNNSAVYECKPDIGQFMEEWLSLYESKSGERGIFNREGTNKQVAKNGRRKAFEGAGTNPCSEIILKPYSFCNLTEVVVREKDTLDSLKTKVRLATILGTFQATLTNFPYLRKIWKKNAEEERLLGVSLTGIYDNNLTSSSSFYQDDLLEELKGTAIEVNLEYSELFGITQSVAITCVKPSGTVSQLVDAASGIHTRHSPFYIRTVRNDNKDPITQFLKDQGVKWEPCVNKPESTTVFSFPIKSPKSSAVRSSITAIEHLELWLDYQRYWCEHKPSVTISVKEHEWLEVGAWVYKHFDEVTGVSFLPYADSDHTYRQAPYQEISEEEYNKLLEETPKELNWDLLVEFQDNVEGAQTLACSGGSCEI